MADSARLVRLGVLVAVVTLAIAVIVAACGPDSLAGGAGGAGGRESGQSEAGAPAAGAGDGQGSQPVTGTVGPVPVGQPTTAATESGGGQPVRADPAQATATIPVRVPSAGGAPPGGPTSPPTTRLTNAPAGDLALAPANGCSWYTDNAGVVWIQVKVYTSWSGTGRYPTNVLRLEFSTITRVETTTTAAGHVTSMVGLPRGLISTLLGRSVALRATVDVEGTVAETNETNNVLDMTGSLPSTLPPLPMFNESFACA